MRHAISKNMREFIAVIVMVFIALGVGGYILSNQRFYLPAWVPVLGTDFFELKAEFSTAQSVTPGQGQTADIAGVPVGEIKRVELVDGRAVVTMAIRAKYRDLVKRDATMLLRPKTGLKDMVIEMDPGHAGRAAVPGGLHDPRLADATRREPRRDPRQPRPRHARLPAPAGRRAVARA